MRVGLIVSNSLRDGPCKNFCRFPFGTRVERVPNVRGETIAAGRRWVAVLSSALPNNHRLNEAWRAQASLASGDAAGEPARAHADTRSVEGFDASLGGKPRERRRGRGTGACTGKPRADTHTHARAHTRTRMHPLACTQQVLRIELDDLQQFDGASWSVLRKMPCVSMCGVHLYVHVCVHACMRVCACVCAWGVHACVRMCVCASLCMRVCMCGCMCVHVCACVCMCVCM